MQLRTWELQMLRRLFKMRWRQTERYMEYNHRTAYHICKWSAMSGVANLGYRTVKSVYKSA